MHYPSSDRTRFVRLGHAMLAAFALTVTLPAAAQTPAPPGFEVVGTSDFPFAAVNNNASSVTHSSDIAGTPYTSITPAEIGVDGLFRILQDTSTYSYQTISDSYTAVISGPGADPLSSGDSYLSFAGVVTFDAGSVLAGQNLSLSLSATGLSTAGSSPVPGLLLPARLPAFYILSNGSQTWQQLSASGNVASGGLYSATASASLGAGSFQVLAVATPPSFGTMSLASFSVNITGSADTDTSLTGVRTDVLYSQAIPALPVPEPGQWAMLLAGLLLTATIARRRMA